MRVSRLKFAALAAISLLGLSLETTPATAGGCWYDGCASAVVFSRCLMSIHRARAAAAEPEAMAWAMGPMVRAFMA